MEASVGFLGTGVKTTATVSSEISAAFEHSWAAAKSSSRTWTSSKSTSNPETESKPSSASQTNVFSNGYQNTMAEETTEEYEYSMTVPPFHRGKIEFFLQEVPKILTWKAVFSLNDLIQVCY